MAAQVINTLECVNPMASAVPRFDEWLSSQQVVRLSSEFGDPEEFARRRPACTSGSAT